jgi:pimeloyl-ACP methyl ester carboxylesterase
VVAAVARLLDRLAAEKVYIIGFSKGGRGAFELARALPSGRINAVTLDDAPLDDSAEAVFAASCAPGSTPVTRPGSTTPTDSEPP